MPLTPDEIRQRDRVIVEVLRLIEYGYGTPIDPDDFNTVALKLFKWQFNRIGPYARLCRSYGWAPEMVAHWTQIPAVPTEAYKDQILFAFSPSEAVRGFRTSGTKLGIRGTHFFSTLKVMDRALWQSFTAFMLPDGLSAATLAFLTQPPSAAPDSSLIHMFGQVATRLDATQRPFVLDSEGLKAAVFEGILSRAQREEQPALIGTTAFALARYFEASARSFALPPGSRLLETGGFKGHATEYDKTSLYRAITERLGIPATHIVGEYGMTELSSQCYAGTLRHAIHGDVPPDILIAPPWCPVRIVDPETGLEVPQGDPGLIQFFDLANVDSVSAIYTSDRGRMREDGGFELLGRLEGAEARGCSLAAAELLGEAGEILS